jgi:ABC-2 type transport system permease protein
MAPGMATLSELTASRELFANLTLRELRGKYKRSALGWTWSLINPLATMAIFTVVFNFFLKVEPPKGDPSGLHVFAFYLLCGLLPWNYLSNSLTGSMGILLSNANLIKKVYFPREILVAASVAAAGFALVIELGVLAVVLIIAGNFVIPWLVPLLLILVLQTVFVTGVGLTFSVLNVYFRDVQHFVSILLQLWFYATPIVYPIEVVPKTHELLGMEVPIRTIYELNPMVRFAEAYRNCLYDLTLPSLETIALLAGYAGVSIAIGMAVFSRFEPRLAEEL